MVKATSRYALTILEDMVDNATEEKLVSLKTYGIGGPKEDSRIVEAINELLAGDYLEPLKSEPSTYRLTIKATSAFRGP